MQFNRERVFVFRIQSTYSVSVVTPSPTTIGHFDRSERPTKIMIDMKIKKINTTKSSPWKMGIRKINEKTTVSRNIYTPTTRNANQRPNTLGAYRRNIAAVSTIDMPKAGMTLKKRMR